LSGPIVLPSGVWQGHALYDMVTGAVRQLNNDSGSADMAWMPGDTRVVYFTRKGQLIIQNISTLERHEIAVSLPLPPDDIWSIAGSPDGQMLYYGAQQVEANIWKVERPKRAP